MKFNIYLASLFTICLSQTINVTSPKDGQSFEYNDDVEIVWTTSRYQWQKVTIYWGETVDMNDWEKIDEVNANEGSFWWSINERELRKTNGEIFIIVYGSSVSDLVKIDIAPIIRSRTGNINFKSNPLNVRVSLNGKYENTTPFIKKGIRFGSIGIKAEKSGFEAATFTFDHQRKNSVVDINLSKHAGTLRLIMNELIEARIIVNGVSHDNADFWKINNKLKLRSGWDYLYPNATKPTSHRKSLRLPVGGYTIVANAKKEKRSTFLKEVTIRRNRTESIEIEMLELQGKIQFNFNVNWSLLSLSHEVDRKYKKLSQPNVTPYLPIKYGKHNFIVKSPKYDSQKFSVNINSEKLYKINKELKLKSKGKALSRNMLFPGVILPGTGQLYSGDRGRGLLYMAVHVALAYGLYDSYSKYTSYSDKANMYKDNYNAAVTGSAIDENWAAYNVNAAKANDASKLMITFSSGLAANWLVTLFDSLFFSGLD